MTPICLRTQCRALRPSWPDSMIESWVEAKLYAQRCRPVYRVHMSKRAVGQMAFARTTREAGMA